MNAEKIEELADDLAFRILDTPYEVVAEFETLREVIIKEIKKYFGKK